MDVRKTELHLHILVRSQPGIESSQQSDSHDFPRGFKQLRMGKHFPLPGQAQDILGVCKVEVVGLPCLSQEQPHFHPQFVVVVLFLYWWGNKQELG